MPLGTPELPYQAFTIRRTYGTICTRAQTNPSSPSPLPPPPLSRPSLLRHGEVYCPPSSLSLPTLPFPSTARKQYSGTSRLLRVSRRMEPFPYFFFSLVSLLLSSHFSFSFSLPRRNSDHSRSKSRLFCPLPTTVRAFVFIARRVQLFLPSSTRIKLRLYFSMILTYGHA